MEPVDDIEELEIEENVYEDHIAAENVDNDEETFTHTKTDVKTCRAFPMVQLILKRLKSNKETYNKGINYTVPSHVPPYTCDICEDTQQILSR